MFLDKDEALVDLRAWVSEEETALSTKGPQLDLVGGKSEGDEGE